MAIEILTLKNGIRVAMEHMPQLRSVCLGLLVKNGSRHEIPSLNGISHFTEHMLFKGTATRTGKEIAEQIEAVGGQINAYTSKERTCFFTRTLDEHIHKGIDILADIFFHSKFDDDDIAKELNVILEEINMYEDMSEALVDEIMQKSVWSGTLGSPILGTKETISTFKHDTFTNFMREKYTPKNIVIAVAGSFDREHVLDLINQYFADFNVDCEINTPVKNEYKKSVVTKEKDIEQLNMQLGFPSLQYGHENMFVLNALNTLFGGGMSSRLFQSIREKHGLAYSIYSSNEAFEDAGIFSINVGLIKENAEKVLTHIFGEITKLKIEKLTAEQLQKTKEQLKGGYILGLESSASRMINIGNSLLMLNRVFTPDQILEKIEAIDLERFYQILEEILDPQNASLSVVGPIGDTDFSSILANHI